MNSLSRKVFVISCLTILPLAVMVIKSFILTRRGWSIPEIQFQTIFWIVRTLLAPLVVLYSVKFWTEINRAYLLLLRQAIGFMAYLFLHGVISFGLIKLFLEDFDPRNWNLVNIIIDNSLLLNFLSYVISVFIFYLWVYFERYREEARKSAILETELTDSKLELIKRDENLKSKSPKEALDKLTVKSGSKVTVVSVQSIAYLQANGPYVKIIADDRVYLLNTPMYELQRMLPPAFLRVHRSYIVNIEFIKQVKSLLNGDYTLILKDGSEIRASRTYREDLRAALGQL